VFLYCERAFFNNKTKAYEVIFDFNRKSDLIEFAEFSSIDMKDSSDTLIIIENVKFKKYKAPRAGVWYDIPIDIFGQFEIIPGELEFRLIKFKLSMRGDIELNFQQFQMSSSSLFNNNRIESINFKDSIFYKRILGIGPLQNSELIVRDVGCGNWNEIIGTDFHLIYDLGGDIKFSNAQMDRLFNKVNLNQPYYVVISHWDLDHYRAILDLDDSELKQIVKIIVPSKMPDTLQLNNALTRLQLLMINIEIIQPSPKKGGRIELISQGKINNFELFRSTDGANINKSGIVLTIEGFKKIGVLTGDHSYPQIYKGVLNTMSIKPYELVIPHHGGSAGKFDSSLWSLMPLSSGCLSTKSLRYRNLPRSEIHNFFIKQKLFHCTECKGTDYQTKL